MQRGDVVWVDLDPVRGNESNKRRPAVIVSNDGANRAATQLGRGVVTVVPVTANVARIYPFQVLLPADRCELRHDSKAQAEQIRSVAVEHIGDTIGRLPADLLAELGQAIRLHLAL
jgi:mRNA interferase MazF